jgi:hypothetical protein
VNQGVRKEGRARELRSEGGSQGTREPMSDE